MPTRRVASRESPKRPPPQTRAARRRAEHAPHAMLEIERRHVVGLPPGVCLQCFNLQQQFTFPFLVYCGHKRVLAVIRSPREHTTFECAPNQLGAVIAKLGETATGTVEAPPRSRTN